MGYDANHDQYIHPDTGILINKFNAKTSDELEEIEATITSAVLASLHLPSNFTLSDNLIFEIHKELFKDIYTWAGEPRKIDISKGDTYFAHAPFVESCVTVLMAELRNDSRLQSNVLSTFVEGIAHYYAEFNAIHPFREGNGRTIRALLSLVSEFHGYEIDWTNLNKDQNLKASVAAMHGDEQPMLLLLTPLISNRTLI